MHWGWQLRHHAYRISRLRRCQFHSEHLCPGNPVLSESRLPRPEVVTLRLQIGRAENAPEPEYVLINDFKIGDRQIFDEEEAAE